MIGLKRGTVRLCQHEKEWETAAQETIQRLRVLFGEIALDIQHVGSTSIKTIKAKPIIDIAVAVNDFPEVLAIVDSLENAGFHYRPESPPCGQLLFACGSFYDGRGDMQTHFIHVVRSDSREWRDYINFRDYMNTFPEKAREYEELKMSLAARFPEDRQKYVDGKAGFIGFALRKALVRSYLGKTVYVKTDRPIGYVHKKDKYTLVYPINYGYIPGVIGGDGEELDVYILGVNEPVTEFTGQIIAIINRENDVEDKLAAAPEGTDFTKEEIAAAVSFQEKYYNTFVETAQELKGRMQNE